MDDHPNSGLYSNFCRNPNDKDTIWCYVAGSNDVEYCDPVKNEKILQYRIGDHWADLAKAEEGDKECFKPVKGTARLESFGNFDSSPIGRINIYDEDG